MNLSALASAIPLADLGRTLPHAVRFVLPAWLRIPIRRGPSTCTASGCCLVPVLCAVLCCGFTCEACTYRYWNDADTMQKIGKAFGDMPALAEMLGGAGGAGGAAARSGAADEAEEGEEVDSAFLQAAMEGDLAAVKKFIADGATGAHHTMLVRFHTRIVHLFDIFPRPNDALPPLTTSGHCRELIICCV